MKELNRLKVVLVEENKTSRWLAEQLGKNTATVSQWCLNTCHPDLCTLDQISKLLNIDVRDLIVSSQVETNRILPNNAF